MTLNVLKTERKGLRTAFTLSLKKIDTELSKETKDLKQLSILKVQLSDKFNRLDVCQTKISECLLQSEDAEKLYSEDLEESEGYRDKYIEICSCIDQELQETNLPCENGKRKFKLPQIELKKFSGEPKDYLAFWSQFQKIHDDNSMANEDKMQYLLQSMETNSKAERLILSFPATADNYSKAVSQLKERFGREDLLVQIYVRDLLSLVMKNAVTGRTKTDLPSLYDELEGKLRALESLGRTKEKYGDFLTPLVESCLPEEVLQAWERSRNHDSSDGKCSRSLEQLMNFLRQEVQGEEMIILARTGFASTSGYKKKDCLVDKSKFCNNTSTASALVTLTENTGRKDNCIFCEGFHASEKCFKAKKMSLIDKRKVLLKKGACFACLKKAGHLVNNCSVKCKLFCSHCNHPHFEIMCPKLDKNSANKKEMPKSESSLSNCGRSENVYMQTLAVVIHFQGRQKIIRALIDSASQSSYLSEKITKQLKMSPLREEFMIHAVFGGEETKPKHHMVFLIHVSDLDNCNSFKFEVFSEKKICGFVPRAEDFEIINELKERKIILTDSFSKNMSIDLLIGADVLGKLLTGKFIALKSGLTAIETKLGWTAIGKQKCSKKDNVLTSLSMHVKNIHLSELWKLETLGISDPTETSKCKENFDFKKFNDKMKILPDGRYELELPWNLGSGNLSDNKNLSWKRYENMIKKLKCGKFFAEYQNVFNEWEKLNIIERVPKHELDNKCHYLPHRPVIKLGSLTTKIRPVFDASASEKGKLSLNECLFKGINLIELIPDIIDRFRMYPIGISADIEKAFLMISVSPKDRDFLRFFFPCAEGQLIYRHCRVVFGVSSSPYLLNASIMHLLENSPLEYKNVAQKLKNSFYIDNCVSGAFTIDEAELFIDHAKSLMSQACFNLRCFEGNVVCKNVDRHTGETSVLGIIWNLDDDVLKCNLDLEPMTCKMKFTKRLVLSIVQRIFDPVGLLTPATLLPKLLLQSMWKLKISWDAELPCDMLNKFLKWFKSIYVLREVCLQRFLMLNSSSEFHVFVDASKAAYAACVFVRSIINNKVRITLVRSKSRVAPIKSLSMPRLELMACCVGGRLFNAIAKALNLSNMKCTFWTDSATALWWIKEHENWSVFVTNRVKEIRQMTRAESWKHVPGNLNIADILSRGCSPQRMLLSKWWEGPDWLKKDPEFWPTGEIDPKLEEVNLERKKCNVINIDLAIDAAPWLLANISDYDKMLRVFSWILRFVNNCQRKLDRITNVELSCNEIENSERCLISLIQKYYLPNVQKYLNGVVIFKDTDDILRLKTKITERDDLKSFLYPIILPDKCEFTKLLVRNMHEKNCHAGIRIMQSLLREKFWIIRARRTIKNVLSSCIICKRFKAKALSSEPTPLPPDRVTDCAVFEIVGIDYAGPLFLKNGSKVWISLFTCAVYRAIHLELVDALSTDAFLLALRRFIARRGRPATIYCDNATNFKGASNDLSKLNWTKIIREFSTNKIVWKFIPPTAPWWGGWWERLVRIIKDLLKRTLGKSVLTYNELNTLICECESIINYRPLTYVSENPQELVPLTPAMFLLENRCSDISDFVELDSQNLRKRFKYRAKLYQDLRQRFRKEYLGELVQKQNERPSREPRVGDIVLVGDDSKKRLFWPLAKVIELIPGRDGKIRTVKLRTQHGTAVRPVQRIFSLEIRANNINEIQSQKTGEKETCSSGSEIPDDVLIRKYTSSGRCVRVPKRLDLLNNCCYVFETPPKSQRGEDVKN